LRDNSVINYKQNVIQYFVSSLTPYVHEIIQNRQCRYGRNTVDPYSVKDWEFRD